MCAAAMLWTTLFAVHIIFYRSLSPRLFISLYALCTAVSKCCCACTYVGIPSSHSGRFWQEPASCSGSPYSCCSRATVQCLCTMLNRGAPLQAAVTQAASRDRWRLPLRAAAAAGCLPGQESANLLLPAAIPAGHSGRPFRRLWTGKPEECPTACAPALHCWCDTAAEIQGCEERGSPQQLCGGDWQ
jgi:hypothetical protein